MSHRTSVGWALASCLLLGAAGAEALDIDFSFLGCFTDPDTPVSAVTWGPSDPQVLRVGVFYDDDPCDHFIAEVKVSSNTGANVPNTAANKSFTFDSISNDPIDSEQECETYRQDTIIFRKHAGAWSFAAYGTLQGTWHSATSRCSFAPPAGQGDFTQKKFVPPVTGYDLYRVASRVTTGPDDAPYYRGVCVGGRLADIQGVPRKACAAP